MPSSNQAKILYTGISDTPAWIVSSANRYTRGKCLARFVIYQGQWNVMSNVEGEITPRGMSLASWGAPGPDKFQTKKQIEERKVSEEQLFQGWAADRQNEKEEMISARSMSLLESSAKESPSWATVRLSLLHTSSRRLTYLPSLVEHLQGNIKALEIVATLERVKILKDVPPFDLDFPQS